MSYFFFLLRITEISEDGAYIYGLHLEAAHWDGTFLDEQIFHRPIESFPIVHIKVLTSTSFKLRIFLNGKYHEPFFTAHRNREFQCRASVRVSGLLYIGSRHF